jgi:hypothetical protein
MITDGAVRHRLALRRVPARSESSVRGDQAR